MIGISSQVLKEKYTIFCCPTDVYDIILTLAERCCPYHIMTYLRATKLESRASFLSTWAAAYVFNYCLLQFTIRWLAFSGSFVLHFLNASEKIILKECNSFPCGQMFYGWPTLYFNSYLTKPAILHLENTKIQAHITYYKWQYLW